MYKSRPVHTTIIVIEILGKTFTPYKVAAVIFDRNKPYFSVRGMGLIPASQVTIPRPYQKELHRMFREEFGVMK